MLNCINLLLVCVAGLGVCVRLNPLENNDKLQDISNQYIAEWQWESWSMKQDGTESDNRSPGPRVNVALWKDSSGSNWYLFGGQPVENESSKVYSDIWKYSTTTRTWERVFPSQTESKGKNASKVGGMMTLRANLFDDGYFRKTSKHQNYNVVLCGRGAKRNNTAKAKKAVWSNYTTRRKKQESTIKLEESKSLAVYGPRTSKSDTVWQIDLKDKLWTSYVCCCDTSTNEKNSKSSQKLTKNFTNDSNSKTKMEVPKTAKNKTVDMESKIDKTEDKIDSDQQHMNIENWKNKKKKINQAKKKIEVQSKKSKEFETKNDEPESDKPEHVSITGENREIDYLNDTRTIHIFENLQIVSNESLGSSKNQNQKVKNEKINKTKDVTELKNRTNLTEIAKDLLKTKESVAKNANSTSSNVSRNVTVPKIASKYCPDFPEDSQPVSWCDGKNDFLITTDLTSSQIALWLFNLKTSHWLQQEIEIAEDTIWPGCSNMSNIRYAGTGEEVYILCSGLDSENRTSSENSSSNAWNSTDPSKYPSEYESASKLVYRIDSKRKILESLGTIELSSYFKTPQNEEIWENETKSILNVIKMSDNLTMLLLAYEDSVDLWILTKTQEKKYQFETVKKIWRGSALKWFNKYNAAVYNLQFVTETGSSEITLIANPRNVGINEYWPRERGRFIIRILKNENLKNKNYENRTRDHNLTYELLQSDFKPSINENQLLHSYSVKVLIFFGVSLAIFTVFGFAVFLKRCVNCPTRIRLRNECDKSPPVIRYSVIPDDLLLYSPETKRI